MSAPLSDFPGGLKLPGHKKRSTQKPIRKTPLSKQLVLPLQQHIGAADVPIVEVGEMRVCRSSPLGCSKSER